ncbi:MAG: hypothetical protein MR816_07085, partial [Blautia sp.]|nr:hypothetical protein [Blautia sp.]
FDRRSCSCHFVYQAEKIWKNIGYILTAQITMKMPSNFVLIAFLSMIIEGNDKVVTPIINVNTVPSWAPFLCNQKPEHMTMNR